MYTCVAGNRNFVHLPDTEAYTFGSGEHGQLGLGVSTKLVFAPQRIITTTPLTEDGAFAVAAGGEHTLIQMKSGAFEPNLLWCSSAEGSSMFHHRGHCCCLQATCCPWATEVWVAWATTTRNPYSWHAVCGVSSKRQQSGEFVQL